MNNRLYRLQANLLRHVVLTMLMSFAIGCDDDTNPGTTADIDAMVPQNTDASSGGQDIQSQDVSTFMDSSVTIDAAAPLEVDAYVEVEPDVGPFLIQDTE